MLNFPTLTFGHWLKRRRAVLGLTQKEVAHAAGCSVATLKKLEADDRRPSRPTAGRLAAALRLPERYRAVFEQVARGEATLARLPQPDESAGGETGPAPAPSIPWPTPATPLIGRAHELETLRRLLGDAGCRLLTLTGPGGIGKTRLAVEAAGAQRGVVADGVYLAALAGVSAPDRLGLALAEAVGLTLTAGTDPQAQLGNYLRDKQTLIVLDNLEHLLEGVGWLSGLLEQAPGLKLLATSREPLRLQAEWVLEVQGLPVPAGESGGSNAPSSSAAELFEQRARQARVGRTLTPDDAPAVARICRLVGGLPLALELAAAWTPTLSCHEIADEIESGLGLLTLVAAPRRDVPERHRSLTAVFDYSWRLLTPDEQRGLRQLAVFRGGFERAAAEQVAGATLPLLAALVGKSLLRRTPAGRYDQHELLRQYGAARLAQDPAEAEGVHQRHSRFYLGRLQAREADLHHAQQPAALAELQADVDNLRLAWQTAADTADAEALAAASGAAYYFFELQQNFQEAEAHFRRALDKLPPEPDQVRGELLVYLAFFSLRQGRHTEALPLFDDGLTRLAPTAYAARAFGLYNRGVAYWALGRFDEAARDLAEGVSLSAAQGPAWTEALALGFAGAVSHDQGDYTAAYRQLAAAMAQSRALGDGHQMLLIGFYFSRTAQAVGRLDEVKTVLTEMTAVARATGNRWALGIGLERMAALALEAGDQAEGFRLLRESVALHRQAGDPWGLTSVLNAFSRAALAAGELEQAEGQAREALAVTARSGQTTLAADALLNLAAVWAQQGRAAAALALVRPVLTHTASAQAAKTAAAQLQVELEAQLTPAALAQTPALSLEAAIEACLRSEFVV